MSFYIVVGKLLLVGLVTLGVLGTWKLGFDNGTFGLIDEVVAQQHPTLPGSDIALQNHRTGIQRVDDLLGTILTFFSPIVRGQLPGLTVQALHFYGQGIATWMLMLVECSRTGNAWTLLSFATLWGLLIENVAMAIALPSWCMVHFLTSTTLLPSDSVLRRQTVLLVHPAELRLIPWAVLIGCGIPSIMAATTDASIVAPFYSSQQFWILARMIHPLFTAIVQIILSMVTGEDRHFSTLRERNRAVNAGLRKVYSAATVVAVASHAGVLTLSFGSQVAPSLFTELYRTTLGPKALFQPVPFWTGVEDVKSITEGAQVFLQWDEAVSCCSILVWAFTVNRNSLSGAFGTSGIFLTLMKTLLWLVAGGPAAAAIRLIQERDEELLENLEPSIEERQPVEQAMAKRSAALARGKGQS